MGLAEKHHAVSNVAYDVDARELAQLGKKPILRRNFSPIAILGLSCSLMVTWEGLFSVFVFGLQNGGPAGLIYGFLFVWTGYTCVVATMGELVSMWPTAGGQYHWVHVLAPEGWKDVLSYLTGWQSVIAWQAVTASGCYLMATAVQGLVINSQSTYKPERWHGTLLAIAIILVCLLFNSFLSKGLPHVETATLALHVSLFLIILVVITVMSPTKSSHSEVWASFLNEGGYESKGLSFFVGLITPVFAFTGVDGAVHMSEEVRNSSRVVPWAMMGTYLQLPKQFHSLTAKHQDPSSSTASPASACSSQYSTASATSTPPSAHPPATPSSKFSPTPPAHPLAGPPSLR
ncbi:uncharacterized protein EKO05_0010492 [Ascochyta rabiei]|uniref:uncharacterized protein n=1 Tax=Didymella rabiei TaxID=5454 RepID=UPI0022094587|nr:uncharacterized protein EKO05_0010492 [Ascochyta rabiei]UPX20252.1 hypothetical protein EKO05_0010492 [Ascochyta rabiei]